MKIQFPTVKYSRGHNCYKVYGKVFDYPGPSSPDHEKLRRKALDEAIRYGYAVQQAMQKEKSGQLSVLEEVTGALVHPSNKTSEPHSLKQPTARPTNPYTKIVEDLQSGSSSTTNRAQNQRQIEHFRKQEAEWNRRQEQKAAVESEDVRRARNHAIVQYHTSRLDDSASADTKRAREQLLQLIHADGATAGDYWSGVRELFGDSDQTKTS